MVSTPNPLTLTPQLPSPPMPLPMPTRQEAHQHVSASTAGLTWAGQPFFPISGELHYSRISPNQWRTRLLQVKAGGINIVSTYVFWIHHQPTEAAPNFSGRYDLARFLTIAAEVGLKVVLRIGPWAHGEARNGGLPDWVLAKDVAVRTDDPEYLALVRSWFGQLGEQVAHLCGPSSAIIGIQLDNELYDQPQHLVTLKEIARDCGMSAPLWTATAWGGAQLPADEVFPLYGGYADGFWVDSHLPWDHTYRAHFFHSSVWDDPGIGADLRTDIFTDPAPIQSPFPPATCELGGGMATAYHRRPALAALDIAAVAHAKIGNGSVWQGYYMYGGGHNPLELGPIHESHATGYPNDIQPIAYDFHAPIGADGQLHPTYHALRQQHIFLKSFAPQLLAGTTTLPDVLPADVYDHSHLRWAWRGDQKSGFVFCTWHQPYEPLADYQGAQFQLQLPTGTLTFPDAPITIPAGTLAHFPVNLTLAGIKLTWATVSALAIMPPPAHNTTANPTQPTIVFQAHNGIEPQFSWPAGTEVSPWQELSISAADAPTVVGRTATVTQGGSQATVLVVAPEHADSLWLLGDDDAPGLYLSAAPLLWDNHTVFAQSTGAQPQVWQWQGQTFLPCAVKQAAGSGSTPIVSPQEVSVKLLRPSTGALPEYGSYRGRQSAPSPAFIAEHAARYELQIPPSPTDVHLAITWAGDIAELVIAGDVVDDDYWDGCTWYTRVPAAATGGTVELRLLPLHPDSAIWLPPASHPQRGAAQQGQLHAVIATTRTWWQLHP